MTYKNTEHLTIKEIREKTGLTSRTLRYYEQLGLLHPAARADAGGYRLYSDNVLDTIDQIQKYKDMGYELKEIRAILDDPDFDFSSSLPKLIDRLIKKRNEIDEQIKRAEEFSNTQNYPLPSAQSKT